MEEVIAPKYNFRPKESASDEHGDSQSNEQDIYINGYRGISSDRVKDIVDNDLIDLKARILQDPDVQNALPQTQMPAETINKGLIPKVIKEVYSHLTDDESQELAHYVVIDSVLSRKDVKEINGRKFIELSNRLIDVRDLDIDLIYSVNPFRDSYEIMSKTLDTRVFKSIQTYIQSQRVNVTDTEALALWPKINEFV